MSAFWVGALFVAGSAMAETVWYGSVGTDRSGTADRAEMIGVRDSTVILDFSGGSQSEADNIQAQQPSVFPVELESYCVLSFDGLFGTHIADSSEINTFSLWYSARQSMGGAQTWTVRGLAAVDSDWTESASSGATWTEKSSGTDWAGGTINNSLVGNYGSVSLGGETIGDLYSIDLTAAAKAYADNLIGGIVLTATSQDAFAPVFFAMDSSETANGIGVVVDQVPEPMAISFLLMGAVALIGGRRVTAAHKL